MTSATVSQHPARALRISLISSLVVGAAVLAVSIIGGWFAVGATLVVGLLIGCTNGLFVDRFYRTELPFAATSMLRLVVLTGIIVAGAAVLGMRNIWPIVMGLGVAQLLLALSASFVSLRGSADAA